MKSGDCSEKDILKLDGGCDFRASVVSDGGCFKAIAVSGQLRFQNNCYFKAAVMSSILSA